MSLTITPNTIPTKIGVEDGSAASPSLYNIGDANTGMFFPAEDTIAFAEGGAEAMRIDSSGNVGIGTASAASKLTVDGVTSVGSGNKLSLIGLDINSGGTPTYVKILTTIPTASANADFTVNIKGFIYGAATTTDLSICWHYYNSTFYNATAKSSGGWAPTIRLSSESGYVAIVLSSPGYWPKFYVESMYSSYYNDDYASGWSWVDADATGSPIVTVSYSSNFGNSFVMTTNGNVGIGTSSPGAPLTVYKGAAGADVAYLLNGSGFGLRIQPQTGGGGTNTLAYVSSGESLSLGTNNTERMRIDSSGNVGIGTSSPSATLSTSQTVSSALTSSIFINGNYAVGNINHGVAFSINGNGAAAGLYVGDSGTGSASLVFTTSPSFSSPTNTERMRITAAGDVGIGTTSPSYTLDVRTSASNAVRVGSSSNAFGSLLSWDNPSGESRLMSIGAYALVFGTNTTERMRITSGGDIGIGTASPSFSLEITRAAPRIRQVATTGTNSNYLQLENTGGAAYIGLDSSLGGLSTAYAINMWHAGAYPIAFGTNNTERMRILSDGKVGIGTASPATALDVNGKVTSTGFITGALYDSAFKRFTNPGGGIYTTGSSSLTGAIKITFPVGLTNTMVKLTVKVYEYATNESFEIHLGGYAYSVGPTWANNPYAYIVGNPTINRQFTVRLGYDGTKAVAYIGELASTWSYPQIYITEVQCGYGGFSESYASGWTIGFEASAFQNVTATISNPQVGYQAVAGDAIQGSVRYTSTTRTAGCFYGGTTTPTGSTRLNYSGYLYPTFLNLAGSADTTTTATHYFVETGTDGFVRPKTLANVRTEIVTTAAVSAATAAGAIAFAAGTAAAPSIYPTGDTNTGLFFPAADTIGVSTGGSERIRIINSAVGIGITPSARSTNFYGLQVAYASMEGSTSQPDAWFSANARYDSSWKYIASNFASIYEQTAGRHSFYTTTSGTAGNAITFSEVFRVGSDKHVYTQGGSDKGYKSSSDVAWTSFTLLNSYTQSATRAFQYRRIGNMVEVGGIFEKAAGCAFADVVATLPSGSRPTKRIYVAGFAATTAVPLGQLVGFEIDTNGDVIISLPVLTGAGFSGQFNFTFTCIS